MKAKRILTGDSCSGIRAISMVCKKKCHKASTDRRSSYTLDLWQRRRR